tara:strand:- start:412 stop:2037 length:1626 start_codon:yes stop_codon:yes gene_type:complete
MSESVTYGTYTFPYPTPFVGQSIEPVYIAGEIDYSINVVSVVGNLTGANLSGLHLQKMQMISGLLSDFKTLSVTNDQLTNKDFEFSKPESIEFSNSDLTTILPYSVNFKSYSKGAFAEFFGIENPTDEWVFTEQDGRVTEVSHNVSAKGVRINATDPLINARNFVNSKTSAGCRDLSLFQTGADNQAFLISRVEDINKSSDTFSVNEVYRYNTTEDLTITGLAKSGVFNSSTEIAFDKEQGLNVKVNASLQGSFTANKEDPSKVLNTGAFTTSQAQQIAVNAVASSLSDYETGYYTFIDRGPSSVSYNINTGENKIDFSFEFLNSDNVDQTGNVLHKRSATVTASKDVSTVSIGIEGQFVYNSPFQIVTGDPATGERFKKVDEAYSGVLNNSGFLNLAVEALQDFTGDATGYHISGDFVNPEPLSRTISKNPQEAVISYAFEFDNRIDLSSGSLSGLQVAVVDKKPLELSGIVPSLGGFAVQKLINRRAGEYAVSASCEASTGDLQNLMNVVSGYTTGVFVFSESSSLDDNTISFNMSKYY